MFATWCYFPIFFPPLDHNHCPLKLWHNPLWNGVQCEFDVLGLWVFASLVETKMVESKMVKAWAWERVNKERHNIKWNKLVCWATMSQYMYQGTIQKLVWLSLFVEARYKRIIILLKFYFGKTDANAIVCLLLVNTTACLNLIGKSNVLHLECN